MTITTIPIGQLHLSSPGFENPRTDTGLSTDKISDLAMDILRRGLLYPILVQKIDDECFVVLAGQRRLRAIRQLIHFGDYPADTRVLARVVEADSPDDARALALADNVHREQLSSYEVARALHEVSNDRAVIAEKTGIHKNRVAMLMNSWDNAIPELRERWRRGEIPEGDVFMLAGLSREDQIVRLAGSSQDLQDSSDEFSPPTIPRRRGPRPGRRKRPGIRILKEMLGDLPKPRSDYERGVRDALSYVVRGKPPSSTPWATYVADHLADQDDEETEAEVLSETLSGR